MDLTLPDAVIALPFASAALLACVGSWRAGIRINSASAALAFMLACLLAWQSGATLPAHLALLTTFVAMTTSWLSGHDIPAALAARQLDRRSARCHHVAFQTLIGAILLAALSDGPAATWLATAIAVAAAAGLTAAVRSAEAQRAAVRLLLTCGAGLMLALVGSLLLYLPGQSDFAPLRWRASPLAVIFLVLGYGGIAGLAPLHSWLPDAVAEGTPPGVTLVVALLANVPLLVILRLRSAMTDGPNAPVALLVALGLATLLIAAFCRAARGDTRRRLVFAGTAQIGIVVFAFGLGGWAATFAGLLLMTMLTLARAAAFQCLEAGPTRAAVVTRTASVLGLAGLPIVALFLIAAATADFAPWLLLPLATGALLTAGSLISSLPIEATAGDGAKRATILELAPVWLQLALAVLLAVAMPGPVAGWFRTMAAFR